MAARIQGIPLPASGCCRLRGRCCPLALEYCPAGINWQGFAPFGSCPALGAKPSLSYVALLPKRARSCLARQEAMVLDVF